jgi:gag-polyprotein putative aspartyl protease
MTERVAKLMKNFDEVSTMLTRIITAERLYVYCRARQPDSKNKATQTGAEDEYGSLSWTACFDDECQIHRSKKDGAGWYPKGSIKGTNSWIGSPKGKAPMKKKEPILTRGQGRSTSPENDFYPEDNHHFYMGNQTDSPHKLMILEVNIQGHRAKAVVDSGCTGNMISPKFAQNVGIQRFKRAQKVYLYIFDGSPVKENGGMIEKETGKVKIKIGRYEKRVKFDIVITQGYDITLGLP